MTAEIPSAAPARWHEAVIERIVHRTPRITSVFLRAPIGAHVAGQHVDVRLTAPDGYQAQRSYSIASAPGTAGIELAIERLEEGDRRPFHLARRGRWTDSADRRRLRRRSARGDRPRLVGDRTEDTRASRLFGANLGGIGVS